MQLLNIQPTSPRPPANVVNLSLTCCSCADCAPPPQLKAAGPPPKEGGVIVLKSKYYLPSAGDASERSQDQEVARRCEL